MIKKFARKVSPDELQDRAMKAGTSWHHHCLSPNCFANDTGEEIIVLEMSDDTLYCASTQDLREVLEEHAYQLTHPGKGKVKPLKHEALDLVKGYVRNGTAWHFHIAVPHCLLSMADHYALIVENDETKGKMEWPFDEKPVGLVRQIDDYYLGRKK